MADITLTPVHILRAGTDITYTGSLSVSNNYFFQNTGKTFLHFKKSGAGEATVTIVTTKQDGGYALADQTVTVPASTGDVMAGPFPAYLFGRTCEFTSDNITGLEVAVLELKGT